MEKKRKLKKFANQSVYNTEKDSVMGTPHVVLLEDTKEIVYVATQTLPKNQAPCIINPLDEKISFYYEVNAYHPDGSIGNTEVGIYTPSKSNLSLTMDFTEEVLKTMRPETNIYVNIDYVNGNMEETYTNILWKSNEHWEDIERKINAGSLMHHIVTIIEITNIKENEYYY